MAAIVAPQARLNPGELANLRAAMLCYGLRPSNAARVALPRYGLDRGFIQGSVFLLDGQQPVNTAVLDDMVESTSAIPLDMDGSRWWIEYAGRQITCPPLAQPPDLLDALPGGWGRGSDYVRLHSPSTVFAAPLRQCIFGAIGKGCTFCTFDMAVPRPVPAEILMDLLEIAFATESRPTDLAFGGGTPTLRDHGVRYYASLAQKARDRFQPALSVELVPPPDVRDLERLVAAGVKSLIMSIEIWDDAVRKNVCPGKSRMTKDDYIQAWTAAVDMLGASQVSSVLLVGLEPEESTVAGIDALTDLGVVPTLIPFRPYESSGLRGRPLTDHRLYLRSSLHCVRQLSRRGLSPLHQGGCTKCGGCSLEVLGVDALVSGVTR